MLKKYCKIKLSLQQKVEALLILTTMLHIGFLIKGFINCDTMETISANQQPITDFPEITICSNVPVRRNATPTLNSDKKTATVLDELERNLQCTLNANGDRMTPFHIYDIYFPWIQNGFLMIETLTKKNELNIMNQLAKMTDEERMNYAEYPLMNHDVSSHYQYTQRTITVDIHSFNNLYYGNCLQYQQVQTVGFYENDKSLIDTLQLKFHIPHFRNGKFTQDDMAEKYYVMIIHEPHTEPIFEIKNIIKLWPQTQTRINVDQIHYTYDKDCVMNRNQTGSNYLYSVEGCLTSCLQQLTIKYCNCQLPQFSSDHQYPSCTGCNKIPQDQLDNCNCPPPCSYFKYNVKTEIVNTAENEMDELKTHLSKTQTALKNRDDAYSNTNKGREYLYAEKYLHDSFFKKTLHGKISIKISNSNTNRINVVSICRFEIILSEIGGILGTYTGLCIMMIIEMGYNYTKKLIQIKRRLKPIFKLKEETVSTGSSSISLVARIEDSVPVMKLFWSAVLFIGLYNTFVQGYQLIGEYTQYSVKTTSEIMKEIKFPAITICSNNMLQPNASQDAIDIVLRARAFRVTAVHKRMKALEVWESSIHQFSNFSYNKRYENGLPLKSYITDCHYKLNSQLYKCRHFHEFSYGLYGNCATFNPGLLNDNDSLAFNPNEVRMQLQYKPPLVADLILEIGLVVYIHPKSTSVNSVDFTEGIMIKPGFNYSLRFSTTIEKRLPAPYPSNCVWSKSPEQQWKNNFHDHPSQYEYTHKECQSSLVYNLSSMTVSMKTRYLYQGRISMEDLSEANYDNQRKPSACPASCRDVIHQIHEFNVDTKMNEAEADENFEDILAIRHQHPISDFNEIVTPYAPSWLTIGPYKEETKVVKEEAVINVENILYQLGGTMGLWVGISFLSLIELKTLIWLKLRHFYKKKFQK
ncbi:hypothetical protein CHUAL_004240 [Chamberlinius hualienensis]